MAQPVAVALFLALGACLAGAVPRFELTTRQCKATHAGNVTLYERSFWQVVSSMEHGMTRSGFAVGVAGQRPERVHVFSQCMVDTANKECTKCFAAIARIMASCLPATGGRIFLRGCYIRMENFTFFDRATDPDDFMKCGDSFDKRPQFSETGLRMIEEVVQRTVEKGVGLAFKNTDSMEFVTMASCWKTVDRNTCSICMANAKERAISCLPATEGRILNSGCGLRYADYDFSNNLIYRLTVETILLYVVYGFGGLGLIALSAVVGISARRAIHKKKKKKKGHRRLQKTSSLSQKGFNLLEFSYSTLEKATHCFDDDVRLGQGGYGEVFKGTLPDGREIAIKRLFASGKLERDEIYNEIDIISRAQHKNLVRFLGCCFTQTKSFLVYEFLVNKSLDRILFDSEKKTQLDWKKRWHIITGIAEGLEYMHNVCQRKIVHRDIKASNILLDAKFRPKIADFGLARFSSGTRQLISTATIAGTFGYLAPEYLSQGLLTEKVDVYSFGVLVMEIVTGVRNNKLGSETSFETLVAHVWEHYQLKKVAVIVEKSLEIEDMAEVIRVVQVGLLCTQESPDLRPNMTLVIEMLQNDNGDELPEPSKPPFIDEHLELSS